jgi:dTDP-4-amino-4,6-dideoxygalactose transaminase
VDIGSSFLPSDIIAAFLYAQIENIDDIQKKRKKIWNTYREGLLHLEKEGKIKLPVIPDYATNNAHMFYFLCGSLEERIELIDSLKKQDIYPVFHYLSLHKSPYYYSKHDGRELKFADLYSNCLIRLPFYYELSDNNLFEVLDSINNFYRN